MLHAPYFSLASTQQLNASFNWAMYSCIQMTSTFAEFVQLTKAKKQVMELPFSLNIYLFQYDAANPTIGPLEDMKQRSKRGRPSKKPGT